MKTKFFILLFGLSIASIVAQPFNKEVTSENKAPMLLGKINKKGLSENSYGKWFQKNYDAYDPDAAIINQIKNELSSYTIELFMGTWCGDSKREVPRFYKVLEAAEFPMERLTAIAVDREKRTYKQSPGGEHEGKNIHRVPTFIFYKNGVEVNRITEKPVTSLEADMAGILQGNYTPNYHGVTLVNELLLENGPDKLIKKSKKILPKLESLVTNRYQMNTYATVLLYSEKKEEALAVYKLNTILFPDEPGTYLSLANTLGLMERYSESIQYYKKTLEVDPENEEAAKSMDHIKSKISD